jgi:hypothetical protein
MVMAFLTDKQELKLGLVIFRRGTIAQDLRGALVEMDAYAAGTRYERSLYHTAISPEPPHLLTPEQRAEAIDALEQRLTFRWLPDLAALVPMGSAPQSTSTGHGHGPRALSSRQDTC